MHAGDALWWLYGSAAMLEQLHPTDARVSFLAEKMRSCVGIVGAHISVPEPTADDLGRILTSIRGELPAGAAPVSTQSQQKSTRGNFSDPEIIEAAQVFINAMVESQLFDWASMIEDINNKLRSAAPFFTYKQARAVVNIATRGEVEDGSSFLDQMEDELPEATKAIQNWAAQA